MRARMVIVMLMVLLIMGLFVAGQASAQDKWTPVSLLQVQILDTGEFLIKVEKLNNGAKSFFTLPAGLEQAILDTAVFALDYGWDFEILADFTAGTMAGARVINPFGGS